MIRKMARKTGTQVTRREFLKGASTALAVGTAVGTGLAPRRLRAQGQTAPPSERILLAFIGVAGRGSALINDFKRLPESVITDVCDVYRPHAEAAREMAGGRADVYIDFRRLLEKTRADAVVIATPPHWHPLISIAAMEAGKDVYCEKPMCLRPDEGVAMLRTMQKTGRVTQLGTQIHAGENFRRVVEIVRSGLLGKITAVRTIVTLNEFPGRLGNVPDSDPPGGLDWDLWLGPLPKRPFNRALFESGGHRYFRACVGSWVNELGPHIMDLAFWAMDPGIPRSARASGGRFALQDVSDIPDTVEMLFEYPDFTMTFSHTAANGYNFGFGQEPDRGRRLMVLFHGTRGTLAADYGSYRLFLEDGTAGDVKLPEPSIPRSPGHQKEFLDAIKTRQQPPCNFQYHLPLAIAIGMGHAALFSGEKITWDAQRQRVAGPRPAVAEATSRYRAPWQLPRV